MFRDWVQVSFCLLAALLITLSFLGPNYISDSGNSFLKDFLDNDILSVLGFITALANASILSIYLHLNYLDDEANFKGTRVRRGLRISGLSLIFVFLFAFLVVLVKPIVPASDQLNAFLNSLGILCVVFALSVLRDILITVAKIPSKRAVLKAQEDNRARQRNQQNASIPPKPNINHK